MGKKNGSRIKRSKLKTSARNKHQSNYSSVLTTPPVRKIFTFIKFSDRYWLEELQKGKIFMRPLGYFKKLEDKNDIQRPDKAEGAAAIYQPEQIRVYLTAKGIRHELEGLVGQLLIHQTSPLNHRFIFCLFALHTGELHDKELSSPDELLSYLKLDSRHREFGDSLLYFTNPDKFIERLNNAINRLDLSGQVGPVEYYDEKLMHGYLPDEKIGFAKPSRFAHQKEYRISVNLKSPTDDHFVLDVGDLSDISKITTIDDFNASIQVSFPDAEE